MLIDDVATWAASVLGSSATVVIANQHGKKVHTACVVIGEVSDHPTWNPVTTAALNEEDPLQADVDVEQFSECTLSFDAYASNGKSLLNALICAAHLPTCPPHICLIEYGDIRNLTALEDTEFDLRFQCDMVFGYSHELSVTLPIVDTVHLTGSVDGLGVEVGEEPPAPEV